MLRFMRIDYTKRADSRDFENKNVRVELEMESSTQYAIRTSLRSIYCGRRRLPFTRV